jgi:hypothetical protein
MVTATGQIVTRTIPMTEKVSPTRPMFADQDPVRKKISGQEISIIVGFFQQYATNQLDDSNLDRRWSDIIEQLNTLPQSRHYWTHVTLDNYLRRRHTKIPLPVRVRAKWSPDAVTTAPPPRRTDERPPESQSSDGQERETMSPASTGDEHGAAEDASEVPDHDMPDMPEMPDIRAISHSILDVICSPAAAADFPRDHRRLFAFIAQNLHDQIQHELDALTERIWLDFAPEIHRISLEERRGEARRQQLERAREARKAKIAQETDRCRRQGVYLNDHRWEAAPSACAPPEGDVDASVTATSADPTDEHPDEPIGDFDFVADVADSYHEELFRWFHLSVAQKHSVQWTDFPLSLSLAFILCSLSRPALRFVRKFIPLPCERTIYNHFGAALHALENNLIDGLTIEPQIDLFMQLSGVTAEEVVSVAVDAMAMSPDRSCFAAKARDYLFVFYAQPLARPKKCFPLHVLRNDSGQAKKNVHVIVNTICDALAARGVQVRYVCSAGDPGYNQRHHDFFKRWYPVLLHHDLLEALKFIRTETRMPVSDYLHVWKNFCNKVKNHPVALCPQIPGDILTCEDLDAILNLGNTLADKSSVGRMRDSYPLQLFSLVNCLACMDNGNDLALLYLLPWALQEEVTRSPDLFRPTRLEKAVLSFLLLLRYFDLSSLPRSEGITQRFDSRRTVAVTFAEDSVWPRILNNGLLLIDFVIRAPADWSFSRLGTHCLENFFGFVRQNARADDRSVPAVRIIARAACVSLEMQRLGIAITHQRRDNVGGVEIRGVPMELTQNGVLRAEEISQSFVAVAGLSLTGGDPPFDQDQLRSFLHTWVQIDTHHERDPAYGMKFNRSHANVKIDARNRSV